MIAAEFSESDWEAFQLGEDAGTSGVGLFALLHDCNDISMGRFANRFYGMMTDRGVMSYRRCLPLT